MGFVVPVMIGAITNDNMTFSAWKLVFSPVAAIYVVGNLVYVLTVEGEPQSWNFLETRDPDEPENKDELGLAQRVEHEDPTKV